MLTLIVACRGRVWRLCAAYIQTRRPVRKLPPRSSSAQWIKGPPATASAFQLLQLVQDEVCIAKAGMVLWHVASHAETLSFSAPDPCVWDPSMQGKGWRRTVFRGCMALVEPPFQPHGIPETSHSVGG